MTGFGGHQCGFRGFLIPQLTNEDDIGVLPQGAAQSRGEAFGIDADLALIDGRFLFDED